ncbi:MAG: 16S rRNA (cytidine(1402)-2'-O)-methyltransferase [Gammaproteobacteria bacterium 28-57-27]|nr:MAG: 16S rRNA (cytidine(1402)-2'-O)-methyltransferase [Gammaproteobacteria bacterium 28-57-27]
MNTTSAHFKSTGTMGILYVVATPIGNLGDWSARAREVLAAVDVIAAEDTRHSRPLLQHFGIGTPLIALHAHNENERVDELIQRLLNGQSLALISDAGTPLVSDPGFPLVRAALLAGVRVSPIPGASAAMAALSVCGLPSDRFVFEGFLPARASARRARLQLLKNETRTLIFFEAPHRLLESLQDMVQVMGGTREAALARELTKTFETVRMAPLDELVVWVSSDKDQQRGESVVLLRGHEAEDIPDQSGVTAAALLDSLLKHGVSVKTAAIIAEEVLGGRKKAHYQYALEAQTALHKVDSDA